MDRKAEAVAKKADGYNCAQAVACAYCDYAGVDEPTMKNLTAALGGGLGTGQGTCGAIIGAGVVLGGFFKERAESMRAMQSLVKAFEARNGAVTCCELKGIGTGRPLRACNDCVADAAEILASLLTEAGAEAK